MTTIDLKAEGYGITLHAKDLCRVLNCTLNSLYARIDAGQVPRFTRFGRRYEWRRHDVETWLANPPRALRAAL